MQWLSVFYEQIYSVLNENMKRIVFFHAKLMDIKISTQ